MSTRSWLYCPGNSPGKIVNAAVYGADGIILDLEDSVSPDHKDEARHLVAEALGNHDFSPCTVGVRINGVGTAWWEEDLRLVVGAGAGLIRIPKTDGAATVTQVASMLDDLESELDQTPGGIHIQCILETPRGIEEAFTIAVSSPRLEAVCFGAEDYCATVGINRNGPEYNLDYARSRIVNASAAAGVASYDTVWSAFRDTEGLKLDAARARALGFDGKSVIHPDQIDPVNKIFVYTGEDLAWAKKVLAGTDVQRGATAVDGAMIDAPIIRRAQRIIDSAAGETHG